jgi:hypothetical protein
MSRWVPPSKEREPILIHPEARKRLSNLLYHEPLMQGVGYSEFVMRAVAAAKRGDLPPVDETCKQLSYSFHDDPDAESIVEDPELTKAETGAAIYSLRAARKSNDRALRNARRKGDDAAAERNLTTRQVLDSAYVKLKRTMRRAPGRRAA